MRTAYLDCSSGISSRMLLGALIDAGADAEMIQTVVTSVGLTNYPLVTREVLRGEMRALDVTLGQPVHELPCTVGQCIKAIDTSPIPGPARGLAIETVQAFAAAHARIHGVPADRIPQQPIARSTVAKIVGCAVGLALLEIESSTCSSLPLGTGFVDTDDGPFRQPLPVTAELLRGVPLTSIPVERELTTATGAALVRTLCHAFGSLPQGMVLDTIGYGAGREEMAHRPNVVRLMIGHIDSPLAGGITALVLETTIDDCSGELLGHAVEKLLAAGAWDCFATAVQMKKSRPGTQLTVIAAPALRSQLERILFEETSTLGIRVQCVERATLPRSERVWESPWGPMRLKVAILPSGMSRITPEYEDCRAIAQRTGQALPEIYASARYEINRLEQKNR